MDVRLATRPIFIGKKLPNGKTQYRSRKTGRTYVIWPVALEPDVHLLGVDEALKLTDKYLITCDGDLIDIKCKDRYGVIREMELDDTI